MILRNWPASRAAATLSTAAVISAMVAVVGSTPIESRAKPTVSRISSSTVTLPLYFGSKMALTSVISPPTLSGQ